MKTMILRRDRDLARGHLAGDRVAASGGSARDVVYATIDAAFGPAFIHNLIGRMVEETFSLGPHHNANRRRFAALLADLPSADIGAALALVDGRYRAERRATAGLFRRHTRARADFYAHTLLALRFIRRYHGGEFALIVAALNGAEEPRD